MAATCYPKNPFDLPQSQFRGVTLRANEYHQSLMVSNLTTIALRVLFYAMTRLEADGSVVLSATQMSATFRTDRSYISKGIKELLKYDFIRPQKRSVYWLSPKIATPIRY